MLLTNCKAITDLFHTMWIYFDKINIYLNPSGTQVIFVYCPLLCVFMQ